MAGATAMRVSPRRWLALALAFAVILLLRYLWTLPRSQFSASWSPDKVNIPESVSASESTTTTDEASAILTNETIPEKPTGHGADDLKNPTSLPDDPYSTTSLPCYNLAGADDVLVIVKTGATESTVKLPTHFKTTLRCVPHYVVYSDFDEDIDEHHVYDALDEVNEEIKHTFQEFEIYNRMQQMGRAGLDSAELTEGTGGRGWQLDKWKFLPIVDKALKVKPDAKWYVFVEADTYMVWPNMLAWLSRLDASKPYYMGSQTQIGNIVFAHGGSGYVVSGPSMRAASEKHVSELAHYDAFTNEQWAGDCVLGQILADVGTQLTWSWPMIQGETPATLDHSQEGWAKKLWCYPAVTYHHISPAEVSSMWAFEQEWTKKVCSIARVVLWNFELASPNFASLVRIPPAPFVTVPSSTPTSFPNSPPRNTTGTTWSPTRSTMQMARSNADQTVHHWAFPQQTIQSSRMQRPI